MITRPARRRRDLRAAAGHGGTTSTRCSGSSSRQSRRQRRAAVNGLFVTATDTEVGKTAWRAACTALAAPVTTSGSRSRSRAAPGGRRGGDAMLLGPRPKRGCTDESARTPSPRRWRRSWPLGWRAPSIADVIPRPSRTRDAPRPARRRCRRAARAGRRGLDDRRSRRRLGFPSCSWPARGSAR